VSCFIPTIIIVIKPIVIILINKYLTTNVTINGHPEVEQVKMNVMFVCCGMEKRLKEFPWGENQTGENND
jgi:hypothetical protein